VSECIHGVDLNDTCSRCDAAHAAAPKDDSADVLRLARLLTVTTEERDEALERRDEFARENRRLRQILDCLARAGHGAGALVEVWRDRADPTFERVGILVCRADRDEVAFVRDVNAGIERLAKAIGGEVKPDRFTRTGVTAEDT
jgi:hypothetical protein